jgi:hypothetical protein
MEPLGPSKGRIGRARSSWLLARARKTYYLVTCTCTRAPSVLGREPTGAGVGGGSLRVPPAPLGDFSKLASKLERPSGEATCANPQTGIRTALSDPAVIPSNGPEASADLIRRFMVTAGVASWGQRHRPLDFFRRAGPALITAR